MTKIIKVYNGIYLTVDTECDNIDDYLVTVPTQDYEGENYFCPGVDNQGRPMWYPISGAELIDCEVIEKAENIISESDNDVEIKTLYLEHIDDVWNIINDDNSVLGTWNDTAFNQNKINGTIKKVEEESSMEVVLEFKLEDMTIDELKKRLDKNQSSMQALKKEEGKVVDECLDRIESLMGADYKDIKSEWGYDKRRGFIHGYRMDERRLIGKEEPLILEGKALIDKLFSMIEGEG